MLGSNPSDRFSGRKGGGQVLMPVPVTKIAILAEKKR